MEVLKDTDDLLTPKGLGRHSVNSKTCKSMHDKDICIKAKTKIVGTQELGFRNITCILHHV